MTTTTPHREITLSDVPAIALGSGVLGTGGGGNTYLGSVWLSQELRERGESIRLIDADDMPNDATVCAIGGMGAPTVGIEKLPAGDEYVNALRALERHTGRTIDAIVCGEIGGSNSMRPLVVALQTGLPIIDGDGMGRAFPELQMDTFNIYGVPLHPLALGDCHGNTVILDQMDSALRVERIARAVTIEMGGTASLAMPIMSGSEMKRSIIRGTYTLAQRLGEAVLTARAENRDPAAHAASLANGHVLFRGKIADIERRTVKGFARGHMKLVGFGNGDNVGEEETLEIVFQNENLVAWQNGRAVVTVPDLISILQLEDGEPVGTEMLRYGLRVAVLAMPAPKELKTEEALKVIGPAAFGYEDVTFQPLPGDLL